MALMCSSLPDSLRTASWFHVNKVADPVERETPFLAFKLFSRQAGVITPCICAGAFSGFGDRGPVASQRSLRPLRLIDALHVVGQRAAVLNPMSRMLLSAVLLVFHAGVARAHQ